MDIRWIMIKKSPCIYYIVIITLSKIILVFNTKRNYQKKKQSQTFLSF